jgi:uncharacterized protein (DUF697 family)
MSKRKLPGAIRRPSADEASAATHPAVQYEAPVPAPDASKGRAPSHGSGRAIDVIEPAPKAASHAAAPDAAAPTGLDAEKRRSQAVASVERHAAGSAFGGIIPLPIANLASVTALNVHMVKRLSNLYGVPYERDRARAMVIALLGGIMPSGLGMITASTLGVIIPASGLIGLAVSSVSALACTRRIGHTLIEHFESGKTLHDIPLIEWP